MKLYNIHELKDSRIFFDKKPPVFLSIFIFFLFGIILSSLYFSKVSVKPYVVKAQGVVTTSDNRLISVQLDGEVESIHAAEGQTVSKGEELFTISNGQEGLQNTALTEQKDELNAKLKMMDRYEKSLDQQINKMKNSELEQEYYGKVELYLLQLQTDNFEKGNINNQLSKKRQKKAEMDSTITTLTKELNSLEDTEENEIKRNEIKGEIDAKKNEIDSMQGEISQLEGQMNNPSSQSKQIYHQLISELGSKRAETEAKLTELEGQISIYKGQESPLVVKAKNNGIIHYLVPLKKGMSIQRNQLVAEVSHNLSKDLEVEAYIDAKDISKVTIGDKVKISINGVNSQKYGTLNGQLLSIDSGTLTQESSKGNMIFYKCLIRLSNERLMANNGDTIKVMKSMPVEARIIYEKETYFDWLLKMVNFKMQ
ncbi:HlyD family efflux transporter periplasmic adaptor subunit [Niallia sp. 03133]|uniref:HlyD family efflux transporter periplasmic adaptor subunit n=1 Tax=Niallia sp. 03133 TaxID=3458060 RepID=UPI004043D0F0